MVTNYTNKRANVKAGQLAKLPYIPNQLVYIIKIEGNRIHFAGFFKDALVDNFGPQKSDIHKSRVKDFQPIPENFKPVPQIMAMIQSLNA